MAARDVKFDMQKLKTLVHYICDRCEDSSVLGKVKLNKILYLSDFGSYYYWGEPITGERYLKHQYGPVSHHIIDVLNQLGSEGKIVERESDYFGYRKKDFVSIAPVDIDDVFSANQMRLIDSAIDFVCEEHTAKSISDLTHDEIWELAEIGEELPYSLAFAGRFMEIEPSDVEWAKKTIERKAA